MKEASGIDNVNRIENGLAVMVLGDACFVQYSVCGGAPFSDVHCLCRANTGIKKSKKNVENVRNYKEKVEAR